MESSKTDNHRMAAASLKTELARVYTSNDALRSVDSFKAVIDAGICTDGSQQGLMEDCRRVIQRVLGTDDHSKLPMTHRA